MRSCLTATAIGLILMIAATVRADYNPERIGLSDTYPAEYGDWPNAFMSGNGNMGIMVLGNAVDGDDSTRWSSAYNDDEWIYVDSGVVKNLTGVKLNLESAYAKS
jgi:hypothetical protein